MQIAGRIPLKYFTGIVVPRISRPYNYKDCVEMGCPIEKSSGYNTCNSSNADCIEQKINQIQKDVGTKLQVYEFRPSLLG